MDGTGAVDGAMAMTGTGTGIGFGAVNGDDARRRGKCLVKVIALSWSRRGSKVTVIVTTCSQTGVGLNAADKTASWV